MKSGNFKFLEPSEPLQACNGTDLPFYPSAPFRVITVFLIDLWIQIISPAYACVLQFTRLFGVM